MSKKKLIISCVFTSIMYVIFIISLVAPLCFFPFTINDLLDSSRSIIQADVGEDLQSLELIDRFQSNHILTDLFTATENGGRETNFLIIYYRDLLFDRYRYGNHINTEFDSYYNIIDCYGFPNDCTFTIYENTIVLTEMQWGRQLWSLITKISALIACTIKTARQVNHYRARNI